MSDKLGKKPEKLASAVYLISGFFSDLEPMKWKMRGLASELVSASTLFKDNFNADQNRLSLDMRRVSMELTTLMSVAKNAGLVSPANHEIISKELLNYLGTLELPEGVVEENGRAVLALKEGEPEEELVVEEPQEEIIPIKDKISNTSLERHINTAETGLLSTVELDRAPRMEKGPSLKEFGVVSAKKSNRKSVIIGLLKRKKEIMIKDVSPLISGCSEKTIQRELLNMVKEGILKKEGEKRWSRYSLA